MANNRAHKIELAKRTAKACGVSQTLTMKIVNEFLVQMMGALIQTGKVTLFNWGTLTVKRRAARKGRDIHRGVPVDIPPKWDITFKPAPSVLRDLDRFMSDFDVRLAIQRAANGNGKADPSKLKPLELKP